MINLSQTKHKQLKQTKHGTYKTIDPHRAVNGVRSVHELEIWILEGLTQADSSFSRGGIPRSIGNSLGDSGPETFDLRTLSRSTGRSANVKAGAAPGSLRSPGI